MATQTYSKNLEVFSKVIATLATDAASNVQGVELPDLKRSHSAVSVTFLPNDKVALEIVVNIEMGRSVPQTVAELQGIVKAQIEGATKYKVHAVNVHVKNVMVNQ